MKLKLRTLVLVALFVVLSTISVHADTTSAAITNTTSTAISVGQQQRLLYKDLLTDSQQKVYDQILAYVSTPGIRKDGGPFSPAEPINWGELVSIMKAVWGDHPNEILLYNPEALCRQRRGNILNMNFPCALHFAMYSDEEYKQMKAAYDENIDVACTVINSKPTFMEKMEAINTYVCDKTTYVSDSLLNQTAWSVFLYGESVCAGYSRATQILCERLGIPCYYVIGYAGKDIRTHENSHAWNVVIDPDGNPWALDVTWNDTNPNGQRQKYFMYPDIYNLPQHELSDESRQLMDKVLGANQ